jgi:hypothetical protein
MMIKGVMFAVGKNIMYSIQARRTPSNYHRSHIVRIQFPHQQKEQINL